MDFWGFLWSGVLLVMLGGMLGYWIGWGRGHDGGFEIGRSQTRKDLEGRLAVRDDLAARGLTGNFEVDMARRQLRAEAQRWLRADASDSQAQGDPLLQKYEDAAGLEWASRILTALVKEPS